MSAFGGVIAINRVLDANTARVIVGNQFAEVIVAPEVAPDALNGAEKQNQDSQHWWDMEREPAPDYARGGMLIQDRDDGLVAQADLELMSAPR